MHIFESSKQMCWSAFFRPSIYLEDIQYQKQVCRHCTKYNTNSCR